MSGVELGVLDGTERERIDLFNQLKIYTQFLRWLKVMRVVGP